VSHQIITLQGAVDIPFLLQFTTMTLHRFNNDTMSVATSQIIISVKIC